MENKGLTKKYGLITAIAMVVGIVIGSGVFFKAEVMLNKTSGDLPIALLAWLLGGIVMVISAYVFAVMGTKFEKVNGVVDYTEAFVGRKYAYYVGWFMSTAYYPAMTSALAWLSSRYTLAIFGNTDVSNGEVMTLASFYLAMAFAINALAPKLAGKLQVSMTAIKLVPLLLMGVVGLIAGLMNGDLAQNLSTFVKDGEAVANTSWNWGMLIPGVCTSVFAYEGWVIATAINSEIKDAKKNLPRALVLGTIVVVVVYMLYYIGISGSVPTAELLGNGASYAFIHTFGNIAGTILTVFIAVSCLGTLNGLTCACCRGFYSLAARGEGPNPKFFAKVDEQSGMPANASILSLAANAFWLFYFFIANLSPIGEQMGIFAFDSTELPLICVYAFYLPLYIMFMKKGKEFGAFKRFVMPVLAILGACLFIYAAIYTHGIKNLGFLAFAAVIFLLGFIFDRVNTKKANSPLEK